VNEQLELAKSKVQTRTSEARIAAFANNINFFEWLMAG